MSARVLSYMGLILELQKILEKYQVWHAKKSFEEDLRREDKREA